MPQVYVPNILVTKIVKSNVTRIVLSPISMCVSYIDVGLNKSIKRVEDAITSVPWTPHCGPYEIKRCDFEHKKRIRSRFRCGLCQKVVCDSHRFLLCPICYIKNEPLTGSPALPISGLPGPSLTGTQTIFTDPFLSSVPSKIN